MRRVEYVVIPPKGQRVEADQPTDYHGLGHRNSRSATARPRAAVLLARRRVTALRVADDRLAALMNANMLDRNKMLDTNNLLATFPALAVERR